MKKKVVVRYAWREGLDRLAIATIRQALRDKENRRLSAQVRREAAEWYETRGRIWVEDLTAEGRKYGRKNWK